MGELLYEIFNGSCLLASNMPLDIALALIEGYKHRYPKEPLDLTIKEMDKANCAKPVSSEVETLRDSVASWERTYDTLLQNYNDVNRKFSKVRNISNTWNNKKMTEYEALVAIRNEIMG